jgi:histidinol-phosphatase
MPAPLDLDLALALDTARRAVSGAAEEALRFFRRELAVEWKADRTPVTDADRAAERAILESIRSAFPTHSILSEESGALPGDADNRWIVDPLDGTRGFARGGIFWGPLVALEHRGEIVAGALALPALGETYWAARGSGAFRNDERLHVSSIDEISAATVCIGEMRFLLRSEFGPGLQELIAAAASSRCPGDLAGCALLLSGRAEAWIEAGAQVWDLAAPRILVREAGGRVTDLDGSPRVPDRRALHTNGAIHDAVVRMLSADSGSAQE